MRSPSTRLARSGQAPSTGAAQAPSTGSGQGPYWSEHLRPRLAQLKLSPAREREIAEELSQHLDDRYEQLRAEGHGDPEARRLALEELDDHDTLAREMAALRQARTPPPIALGSPRRSALRDVLQDLRYAARMLRRQPGFAIAAVLTLALGIGANTAVFSLVNATLLQRLPVADRDRLVYVYRGAVGNVFSYPQYAALRDHNRSFDGLAGWGGITASLNAGDSAELVSGFIVTGNLFDVLGVRAARGRLLSPRDDETPGAHPVAVISHDFWQTRFGGRDDAIGREVRLNGHVFTIVGVAPAGFPGPTLGSGRSLYVPMMMQAIMRPPRQRYSGEQNPDLLKNPTNSWIFGVGHLQRGVSAAQAAADLDAVMAEYLRQRAQGSSQPAPVLHVTTLPIDEANAAQRQQMRSVAFLLGGAVGAVLLIACANIANLLLSRAAARRREIAVRLALGASRARLIRQLLTESVLLSLLGGVAGVLLAWAIIGGFRAAPPPAGALPLAVDFAIDQRVLLFALLLSCVTGILFGVAPALEASRPGLVPALKGGDNAQPERASRLDLKKGLVVAEVALSLLLLITAGLFVRSLQAARTIDPGIDVERLASAPLNINLLRYTTAQGREFYQQAIERVERLPGVESATVARVAILGGTGRVLSVHVEGRQAAHDRISSESSTIVSGDSRVINANVVGPRYFVTLGVPLVNGRDFATTDTQGGPPVIILNVTAATMHFPGANPIGSRVSVDGPQGPWREIVGIVRDTKYGTLAEDGVPVAYMPLAQNHETGMTLYVRASVPPATLVGGLRREIQALEPNLPVPAIQTMPATIGASLYAARMGAWLLSVSGGLALLLAVIGIYGVLSFTISRRTREMGIRMALGADTRQVFLLVVRDGMLLVGLGILIGLGGGLAGSRSLTSFLHGVSTTDAPTFAATVMILSAVALIACAIPARRAIRVSPIAALRQE
jgi:macrolide transport system ATP-binding/permease protein